MKKQHEIIQTESLSGGFLPLNRYRLRHTQFSGGWGGEIVRERVEGYRAATLLPYDPKLDQVVLIEQFRIGAMEDAAGAWLLEVVGGVIDDGEESAESVARREMLEEAGCIVSEIIPICEYMVSPGTTTERIQLFCGRVDASRAGGIFGVGAEGEDIRVEVMSAQAAISELYGGRVNSSATLIAIQWLALNREALQERWLAP